ncbi:substrate-binding periplasmic protein [Kordiimonas marina]|uniref:substrate-binding periplasmic protein n=1 Tax=Kordiimonas marina TaxID=2872312 RepID=UPI001FF214A1|nr:transporter substrate-binding domain-containing protein [Kordiimonas marina]
MSAGETNPHLSLLTEQNPPYNFRDPKSDQIEGSAVEIVKELMRRANVDYSLTLMPTARAYRAAKETPNTCAFVINRTKTREATFKWVGPLIEGGWALYRRPGSSIVIHDLDDLKPYVVAGKLGSASVKSLERSAHIKVLATINDDLAAKMLYHGRADLWISGVSNAPAAARDIGVPPPELALLWKKADLSLACSRKTDPALIADLNRINQTLDDLRKKALAAYSQGLPPTP